MEGYSVPGPKKQIEEEPLFIEKSDFLNKLFSIKQSSKEIVQVRDLNSKIVRKIGDQVISNGRIFQKEGVKGVIKSFKDDTCYIGVEWEDGTTSFMKDKDLIGIVNEKQEKDDLIKQAVEIFEIAQKIALKLKNKRVENIITLYKEEIKNPDLNIKDILFTIKECRKFINKHKNLEDNSIPSSS